MSAEIGQLTSYSYRVPMSDVDSAGVIYYANPYLWRERMFTGWLAEAYHPLSELLAASLSCPAISSSARYLRPVRLDDVVRLSLVVEHLGTSSFGDRMDVTGADGQLAIQVRTTQVWVTLADDGRPAARRVPDDLRALLTTTAPGRAPTDRLETNH